MERNPGHIRGMAASPIQFSEESSLASTAKAQDSSSIIISNDDIFQVSISVCGGIP